MVKEYGKKVQEIVINIKENIKMTKNAVMVSLLGRMEIFIRVIMKVI